MLQVNKDAGGFATLSFVQHLRDVDLPPEVRPALAQQRGASVVTISPNGGQVASLLLNRDVDFRDNGPRSAILLFARDPATGLLTPKKQIAEDTGLQFPSTGTMTEAISPDGRHAYMSGFGSEIYIQSRDSKTGRLIETLGIVEVDRSRSPGAGDARVGKLLISPDGRYLFAAVGVDGIRVYSRDQGSGQLALATAFVGGDMGYSGMELRDMALSPDGQSLFVLGALGEDLNSPAGIYWLHVDQTRGFLIPDLGATGPSAFVAGDVLNLTSVLEVLQAPDEMSRYLWPLFLPAEQQTIADPLGNPVFSEDEIGDGLVEKFQSKYSGNATTSFIWDRMSVDGRSALAGNGTVDSKKLVLRDELNRIITDVRIFDYGEAFDYKQFSPETSAMYGDLRLKDKFPARMSRRILEDMLPEDLTKDGGVAYLTLDQVLDIDALLNLVTTSFRSSQGELVYNYLSAYAKEYLKDPYGAPLLYSGDVKTSLVQRLTNPGGRRDDGHKALESFLWARFSSETQQLLQSDKAADTDKTEALRKELNKFLGPDSQSLYSDENFPDNHLFDSDTSQLLSDVNNGKTEKISRLNRKLLEFAFPRDLVQDTKANTPAEQRVVLIDGLNEIINTKSDFAQAVSRETGNASPETTEATKLGDAYGSLSRRLAMDDLFPTLITRTSAVLQRKEALAEVLNRIMGTESLYQKDDFRTTHLSTETDGWLRDPGKNGGDNLSRFNRVLLEDALLNGAFHEELDPGIARRPIKPAFDAGTTDDPRGRGLSELGVSPDGQDFYVFMQGDASRGIPQRLSVIRAAGQDAGGWSLLQTIASGKNTVFGTGLAVSPNPGLPGAQLVFVAQASSANGVDAKIFREGADGLLAENQTLIPGATSGFSAVFSPDGQRLYLKARSDQTQKYVLYAYEVGGDGELTLLNQFEPSVQDQSEVMISSDGRFLYAKTSVFALDDSTGAIQTEIVQQADDNSFEFSRSPGFTTDYYSQFLSVITEGKSQLAYSPDGNYLYVSGIAGPQSESSEGLLVIDARDDLNVLQGSGTILYQGIDTSQSWNFGGLLVSPDRRYLYMSVNDHTPQIVMIELAPATAAHSIVDTVSIPDVDKLSNKQLSTLGGMAISHDGQFFYLTRSDGNGMYVFSRDPQTGTLNPAPLQTIDDNQPVVLTPVGLEAATLSPRGDYIFGVRSDEDVLVAIMVKSDGTFVSSQILKAGFEDVDGSGVQVVGLDTPRAVAVSPDGNYVYVACEFGGVTVFQMTDGLLHFAGVLGSPVGLKADSILLLPDEDSNNGSSQMFLAGADGLRVFHGSRMDWGGAPIFANNALTGLTGLSANQDRTLITALRPAAREVLLLDAHNGNVIARTTVKGTPSSAALTADRQNLYVTDSQRNSIVRFRFDGNATLTLQEETINGAKGIKGLQGASAVAVAQGDRFVYVAGKDANALTVFLRNETVDNVQNTITFGRPHNLQSGDEVLYRTGGGTAMGGLVPGRRYYAVVESDRTIGLAATLTDAQNAVPVLVDLDATNATGEFHKLIPSDSHKEPLIFSPEFGKLFLSQLLQNDFGGASGLSSPNSIVTTGVVGDERVYVASGSRSEVGSGGVALFLNTSTGQDGSVSLQPANSSITFTAIEKLTIETGNGADSIQVMQAPPANLAIKTNGGPDFVRLSETAPATSVDLGDGSDFIHLDSTLTGTVTTIVAGAGLDSIYIDRAGSGSSAVISGGTEDDTFTVSGDQLASDANITLHGEDTGQGGDRLRFDPGSRFSDLVLPSDPQTPAGQVRVTGFGTVIYDTIESFTIAAPPIFIGVTANPASIFEGDAVELQATFKPGSVFKEVAWDLNGDGVFDDAKGKTIHVTWRQLRNAGIHDGDTPSGTNYRVLVRARNDDGDRESSVAFVILNTPPLVSVASADGHATPGEPYAFRFSISDPGEDRVQQIIIDWGDGTPSETFGAEVSTAPHIYASPGTRTIRVTAQDEDFAGAPNQSAFTYSFPVDVGINTENLNAGGPYVTNPNQDLMLRAKAPGQPDVVEWDVNGDGDFGDAVGLRPVVTWTSLAKLLPNVIKGGETEIQLRVTYTNGDQYLSSGKLTIHPEVTLVFEGPGGVIKEGDNVRLAFVWPEGMSPVGATYSYDFDLDASPDFDVTGVSELSRRVPPQLLTNERTLVARGKVHFADGTEEILFAAIAVRDARPTVSITGGAGLKEGDAGVFKFQISDPGDDPVTEWQIDWGDGSSSPVETSVWTERTETHTYLDDGIYAIRLLMRNKDGHFSRKHDVTVERVAPVLTLAGVATIDKGASYSILLGVAEPGADTIAAIEIDWGDGSQSDLPGHERSASHVYSKPGSFEIRAKATDEDGTYQFSQTVLMAQQGTYSPDTRFYFTITDKALNWRDAEEIGAKTVIGSGHLGSHLSPDELAVVSRDLLILENSSQGIWIGLNDEKQEGAFVWSEGTTPTFYRWASYHPDDPSTPDVNESDVPSDNTADKDYTVLVPVSQMARSVGHWTLADGSQLLPGLLRFDALSRLLTAPVAGDHFSVTVANTGPTIGKVTVPESIPLGTTLTLEAEASNAIGGTDGLTFAWLIISPDRTRYDLTGAKASFVPALAGRYLVSLTVSDDTGGTTVYGNPIESLRVDVFDPQLQVVSFQVPATALEGSIVPLDALVVDPIGNGALLDYLWIVISPNHEISTLTGPHPQFAIGDDGRYTVHLVATGVSNRSVEREAFMQVANVDPRISRLIVPAVDLLGNPIGLSAQATDAAKASDPLKFEWSVTTPDGRTTPLVANTATFNPAGPGKHAVTLTVTDDDGGVAIATASFTVFTVLPRNYVVSHLLFYNNSAFDQNDPSANEKDDDAVAPDKIALRPGQTATFANYSSYSRGVNGVMIDLNYVPGALSAEDFVFAIGNSNTPNSWQTAPNPTSISVRTGAGINRSDRVTLVWPDNLLQKEWLRVTVLANERTRLERTDTFYFGNAIGESGDRPGDAKVDLMDISLAGANRRDVSNPAGLDDPYDYNRDRKVDVADLLIASNNQTSIVTALVLITAPQSAAQTVTVSSPDTALTGAEFSFLNTFQSWAKPLPRAYSLSVFSEFSLVPATLRVRGSAVLSRRTG